jgi:hypothetical protein
MNARLALSSKFENAIAVWIRDGISNLERFVLVGWDVGQSVTTPTSQHQLSLCSPTVSSPERPATAMDYTNLTSYASPSYSASISNTMFSSVWALHANISRFSQILIRQALCRLYIVNASGYFFQACAQ